MSWQWHEESQWAQAGSDRPWPPTWRGDDWQQAGIDRQWQSPWHEQWQTPSQEHRQQWADAHWQQGGWSDAQWQPWADEPGEEVEAPARRTTYPRFAPNPSTGPRGKDAGGTRYGFAEGEHEVIPDHCVLRLMTCSDLKKIHQDWKQALQSRIDDLFKCRANWKKGAAL